MDEVENPSLPAADEAVEDGSPPKPALDTAATESIIETEDPLPDPQIQATAPPVHLPTRPAPPKRDSSVPPPQQPPPPPPHTAEPSEYTQEAPDSLTLADLKRIRSTFPSAETPPKQQLLGDEKVYDFDYQDAQSLPAELEEWFSYSELERKRLRFCRAAFDEHWRGTGEGNPDWLDATEDARRAFVSRTIGQLRENGLKDEGKSAVMVLTYIGLGVWEETAGREGGCALAELFPNGDKGGSRLDEYAQSSLQIQWIVAMVDTLQSCGGMQVVYDSLRGSCEAAFQASAQKPNPHPVEESFEMWCCLTLTYVFVEVARTTGGLSGQALKKDIVALEPNLLNHLTEIVAKLRWDETAPVPLTKMLLLAWKAILVSFGGIEDVENVKASLREHTDDKDDRGQPIITASPLDYHLFRQELNSKYPAYQPPPPLFPLEPESNTILPPLKHRRPSYASIDTTFNSGHNVDTQSIMHEPVHIATPAPSPPPSPAGPGKAVKKQNYQTNQMFPFLYPPLDENSNELGGKGSTELQDALVGRKWQGSDIPTSILEAAELFAKRMRATRAMKQLWEARVDFMKFERGWNPSHENTFDEDDFQLVDSAPKEETAEQGQPLPQTDEQRRLAAVNKYYEDSLPHLQSVVIVLLKAVLQNVTDLVTKNNGQNGLQAGIQFNEPNGANGSAKPMENGTALNGETFENSIEELDKLRSQEISAKGLSAILLLLLKWFKASHILQYEYLTQLLLDSNYVPLILKLWQTQEIGRACHYNLTHPDLNFFHLSQADSREGIPARPSSSDSAAPPPIKLHRHPTPPSDHPLSPTSAPAEPEDSDFTTHPPEVDELGYPTTGFPPNPLKTYSYRNLFTSINHLRILQKITRRKTHRALLLVSYKSSNHLKKTLRIPVQELRYYTLKLFKSQVPFCGRKWRQANMKTITAVYLSVPAELRDDWLCGGGGGMGGACVGDVDGTVEDALPLEQGMRALTHWWNLTHYSDVMGVEGGVGGLVEGVGGWFERELGKMGAEGLFGREEEVEVGGDGAEWGGPIEGY